MVKSVGHPTLDFGSGGGLRVLQLIPVLSGSPPARSARDSVCLSPPPPLTHSNKWANLKKKNSKGIHGS